MTSDGRSQSTILVVEDVEETRLGIERLLIRDGYKVNTAYNEDDATFKARVEAPDLILMSLGFDTVGVGAIGRNIRDRSELPTGIPVVVFCIATIDEVAEAD